MTFSREWNEIYSADNQRAIWPWSDLVSYVHRYAKPADGFERVLEVGCGAGANIPFFLKLGVEYFAVDGSSAIIERLHAKYPHLQERILSSDFTQFIPFDGPFDLVVDRAAITHNTSADIRRVLAMLFNRLREGGKFIGIDWFSARHADLFGGDALDSHTRTNIAVGSFAGLGAVHFSDQNHLVDLLARVGFHIERLEHKLIECLIPGSEGPFAAWNFVAVKP